MTVQSNLVGMEVGAQRWPYSSSHPDCWAEPHRGTILATDDPRAWSETIAFPTNVPNQEDVTRHVQDCHRRGLLRDKVPVCWKFPDGEKVFWESTNALRSAIEDHEEWLAARNAAYDRQQISRHPA